MNPSYKLRKVQIKRLLVNTFPEYTGRKFTIEFRPTLTFYDLNWSGGTKNEYRAVRAGGQIAAIPSPAPWANPIEGLTVELPPDVIIVEHTYFCGRDCGIRLYAHPSNLPKWIAAPAA